MSSSPYSEFIDEDSMSIKNARTYSTLNNNNGNNNDTTALLPSHKPVDNSLQTRVLTTLDSLPIQAIIILLIMTDLITLLVEVTGATDEDIPSTYGLTITILSVFVLELCVRIWASAPTNAFFSSIWMILDGLVIIVSFILALTEARDGRFIIVLRFARAVRIIFRLRNQRITKAARNKVSQNKRRYQTDGFDLDLTYITPRVIGMSAPSEGLEAAYRNPIAEVARFFDTKHEGHYRIYDTRAEYSYDTSIFHNRVKKFPIDDHNVAPLFVLLDFCKDAEQYYNAHPDNVIAVHCRGGKGRTGTLVCSWLLWNGVVQTAKEATDWFAERRTDKEKGASFQGIETPSQNRYVGYFEWMIKENQCLLPNKVPLILDSITIRSMPTQPNRGPVVQPQQLFFTVQQDGDEVIYDSRTTETSIQTSVDSSGRDLNTYSLNAKRETVASNSTAIIGDLVPDGLTVAGDTRVHFYVTTGEGPIDPQEKGTTACYLWFHTFFVENKTLILDKAQIDRAFRDKKKMFSPDFQIEFKFK